MNRWGVAKGVGSVDRESVLYILKLQREKSIGGLLGNTTLHTYLCSSTVGFELCFSQDVDQ